MEEAAALREVFVVAALLVEEAALLREVVEALAEREAERLASEV